MKNISHFTVPIGLTFLGMFFLGRFLVSNSQGNETVISQVVITEDPSLTTYYKSAFFGKTIKLPAKMKIVEQRPEILYGAKGMKLIQDTPDTFELNAVSNPPDFIKFSNYDLTDNGHKTADMDIKSKDWPGRRVTNAPVEYVVHSAYPYIGDYRLRAGRNARRTHPWSSIYLGKIELEDRTIYFRIESHDILISDYMPFLMQF